MTPDQIEAAKKILERYGYTVNLDSDKTRILIVWHDKRKIVTVQYSREPSAFLIFTSSSFGGLEVFTREANEAIIIMGLLEKAGVPIVRR